ncbi:hypothetical protein G6O69_02675 [Pseudenhygromyxa sp. WMMC2535]|uniref:hypothetical protein n=1 Tax=Pseudenhygromyxa sp. WMMC2535 TaxID=2712867 RepID=UPI0015530FBC|nr:hypothetical protein [Pseudenhygromyxa sp. WMMC2535]NVB36720.1 hypothetical protein [Pseudenhygromyxa sp. WMMC2535]
MAKVDAKHAGPNFWEKLQPRERTLVLALIGVFFVMSTALLFFLRHQKLSAIDEEVADLREGLDMTRTFGASYQEKLAEIEKKKDKFSSEKLLFSSLIEQAESVAEVKTGSQAEKPPVELTSGLQMRAIEVDLRSVSLAQLTKFLSEVEGKEGHTVLTTGLSIRSPSASEDRLNVEITLATYERTEASEDADADAAEEEE